MPEGLSFLGLFPCPHEPQSSLKVPPRPWKGCPSVSWHLVHLARGLCFSGPALENTYLEEMFCLIRLGRAPDKAERGCAW